MYLQTSHLGGRGKVEPFHGHNSFKTSLFAPFLHAVHINIRQTTPLLLTRAHQSIDPSLHCSQVQPQWGLLVHPTSVRKLHIHIGPVHSPLSSISQLDCVYPRLSALVLCTWVSLFQAWYAAGRGLKLLSRHNSLYPNDPYNSWTLVGSSAQSLGSYISAGVRPHLPITQAVASVW